MKMALEYNLWKRERQDYWKLADIQLQRQTKGSEIREKLYPIEVEEREGERVKIHYIGYGDDEDEWREASELVQLSKSHSHTFRLSCTESWRTKFRQH